FPDTPCDFYAGHERHRIIDDRHVRPHFDGGGEGLIAVVRLSNDLPAWTPFQQGTQPRSHRFMIISYKNPFHDPANSWPIALSPIVAAVRISPNSDRRAQFSSLAHWIVMAWTVVGWLWRVRLPWRRVGEQGTDRGASAQS